MALIPPRMHRTAAAIYELHAARINAESPRDYLGVSEWGEECARRLWYGWRNVMRPTFSGQLARLFESGHREEDRLFAELIAIGCQVDGQQRECEFVGGHVKGHADGIVRGLLEAPKTPHLVDAKTIKRKKMDELKKKGFRETFPKYWAQGQGYMGAFGLERAAFIFMCKDDEEILVERFEFDREGFEKLVARAESIIKATEPPPRLSDDPEFYLCGWCDYKAVCHGDAVPLVSCRTCLHSTPITDGPGGRWKCEFKGATLPKKFRGVKCQAHRYIPALLANIAEPIDADAEKNIVFYRRKDGTEFANDRAGL